MQEDLPPLWAVPVTWHVDGEESPHSDTLSVPGDDHFEARRVAEARVRSALHPKDRLLRLDVGDPVKQQEG